MNVVASGEITAQDSLEIFSHQVFDDFSSSQRVVFVVPDARSGDAPDIAVDAAFAPTGFIRLHGFAGTDLCLEIREHWLCIFSDPMEQFHRFPRTYLKAV